MPRGFGQKAPLLTGTLDDGGWTNEDWNPRQFPLHLPALMRTAFFQSEWDQPHPARTRAIPKAHPEIRDLMGRNPFTALIALVIVADKRESPTRWAGAGVATGG